MITIGSGITAAELYSPKILEHANYLRSLALLVDQDPQIIQYYLEHPSIQQCLYHRDTSCLERTQLFEALAYGDPGVLLTLPGPSLSGQIINELGDNEQQDFFYNYITRHAARTFLAVTEPNHGSDASQLQSKISMSLDNRNLVLDGEKCFVGNGAIAPIGVVIARQFSGPLGIVAVLITPGFSREQNPNLIRNSLETIGLRGASLSHLIFKNYAINSRLVLGQHLRVANRGLMALLKTFNRMRTCVGALAIGTAQAALDYIHENRSNLSSAKITRLQKLYLNLKISRNKLYQAAIVADKNPFDTATISLAKVIATRTAEKIIRSSLDFFDEKVFWEHPLIEKWHRDVFGFEYMEGTTQIHYKNISTKLNDG